MKPTASAASASHVAGITGMSRWMPLNTQQMLMPLCSVNSCPWHPRLVLHTWGPNRLEWEGICSLIIISPQGTEVFPLLGSILHDPSIFKHPEEFNPDRFLDADGRFRKHEAFLPFSLGICCSLGYHEQALANSRHLCQLGAPFCTLGLLLAPLFSPWA